MSEQILQLFSAIDSKDTDSFVSFLTDDVTFKFGNADAVTGRENVGAAVEGFFGSIKSLSHTISDVTDGDKRLACHGTVTYVRHDDSMLSVPFANVFNMDGSKIKDYLIFVDVSTLYS